MEEHDFQVGGVEFQARGLKDPVDRNTTESGPLGQDLPWNHKNKVRPFFIEFGAYSQEIEKRKPADPEH